MEKINRNVISQKDFEHIAQDSERVFATIREISIREQGIAIHVEYEIITTEERIRYSKPVLATFKGLENFQKEHGETEVIINMGEFVFYLASTFDDHRVRVDSDVMENIRAEIESVAPDKVIVCS